MELRDLYDENRVLTGETIQKGEDVPAGRYYVTVAVFIENDDNKFLLQINKKYDMWTTTGGHPKSGESSLDGIVIEIEEELGYKVSPDKLELVKTYKTEDGRVIEFHSSMGAVNWFVSNGWKLESEHMATCNDRTVKMYVVSKEVPLEQVKAKANNYIKQKQ